MDKDTTKLIEQLLAQLSQINAKIDKMTDVMSKFTTDLGEFSERFEEVMSAVEDERRLDMIRDNY